MKTKYYFLVALVVVIGIAVIVLLNIPISSNPPNCKAPFFSGENLNQTIIDDESAYNRLINLEPGWSNYSDLYLDYKNSVISDINYTEISVGTRFEKIYAYVLKDQVAIDSNGQVYRRGGCI